MVECGCNAEDGIVCRKHLEEDIGKEITDGLFKENRDKDDKNIL